MLRAAKKFNEASALRKRIHDQHRRLVREGRYRSAALLLQYMVRGEVILDLSPTSEEVNGILFDAGAPFEVTSGFYLTKYTYPRKGA